MEIIYRKAVREDIPLLAELRIRQLDDEEEHPQAELYETLVSWFHKMYDACRLYEYLAVCSGNIIGTGALLILDLPPDFFNPSGRTGYLTNMYTAPDYRRIGIASELLKLLIKEAESLNLDNICLEASKRGEPLYRKYGFEPADAWMILYLNNSSKDIAL